jgi:hypothetical protein
MMDNVLQVRQHQCMAEKQGVERAANAAQRRLASQTAILAPMVAIA